MTRAHAPRLAGVTRQSAATIRHRHRVAIVKRRQFPTARPSTVHAATRAANGDQVEITSPRAKMPAPWHGAS